LEGSPVTSLGVANRVVVLNIWATWCGPCRRELPSLEKLTDALDEERFVVVGLSIDEDPRQVAEYLASKGVTYSNLIDGGGRWVNKYQLAATYPSTFIIGRDGTVLAQISGERAWHTARTVAALERAWQDGQPVLLE
jgi:thiol-disulfide isomerase/thioredoxin